MGKEISVYKIGKFIFDSFEFCFLFPEDIIKKYNDF